MCAAMDHIRLQNLVFYGYHGVHPEERTRGKRFFLDVDLGLDLRSAGRADDLAAAVDYAQVYRVVREVNEGRQFTLLEGLAEEIAARLLAEFPAAEVTVRARKADVSVGGALDGVEVEVHRARGEAG